MSAVWRDRAVTPRHQDGEKDPLGIGFEGDLGGTLRAFDVEAEDLCAVACFKHVSGGMLG